MMYLGCVVYVYLDMAYMMYVTLCMSDVPYDVSYMCIGCAITMYVSYMYIGCVIYDVCVVYVYQMCHTTCRIYILDVSK